MYKFDLKSKFLWQLIRVQLKGYIKDQEFFQLSLLIERGVA